MRLRPIDGAHLGCPALGAAIVPDQVVSTHSQAGSGLIAGGRSLAEIDDETVGAELHAFLVSDRRRREQRARARHGADGLGARRVVAGALG